MDPGAPTHSTTLSRLKDLLPVYEALLSLLAARHIAWVQLDEPCLTMELEADTKAAYRQALTYLVNCPKRPRLLLTTYFGALADNLPIAVESGCDGLHVDLVCAPEQLHSVLEAFRPRCACRQGLSMAGIFGAPISTRRTQRFDAPSQP